MSNDLISYFSHLWHIILPDTAKKTEVAITDAFLNDQDNILLYELDLEEDENDLHCDEENCKSFYDHDAWVDGFNTFLTSEQYQKALAEVEKLLQLEHMTDEEQKQVQDAIKAFFAHAAIAYQYSLGPESDIGRSVTRRLFKDRFNDFVYPKIGKIFLQWTTLNEYLITKISLEQFQKAILDVELEGKMDS